MKIKHPFLWTISSVLTFNISILFLGGKLGLYKDDGWYKKWYYWVLGALFGVLPALIMLFIFIVQTNVKVCDFFDVGGSEIYTLPYVWIGLLLIPFIGWTLFIVLLLYIYVMYIINLYCYKG
ncbi:MAG: hypothetical protein IKE75_06025 [Bacilli bacterium]|nr:hypothetical protein [Bacilli bacterium]